MVSVNSIPQQPIWLLTLPSVSSQGQTDSVYFDLSKAFDIVPHNILLRKLSNFGLYSNYVDWFHSYLSSSTPGPLLFNIYISMIFVTPFIILNAFYLLMT
jgi:hypothetical protein